MKIKFLKAQIESVSDLILTAFVFLLILFPVLESRVLAAESPDHLDLTAKAIIRDLDDVFTKIEFPIEPGVGFAHSAKIVTLEGGTQEEQIKSIPKFEISRATSGCGGGPTISEVITNATPAYPAGNELFVVRWYAANALQAAPPRTMRCKSDSIFSCMKAVAKVFDKQPPVAGFNWDCFISTDAFNKGVLYFHLQGKFYLRVELANRVG